MFCGNCGKEITNNSNVCGYCGSPVKPLNGGRKYNIIQKNNRGLGEDKVYKPDDKFNIWAFIFSCIWALTHGLWDIALAVFVVGIVMGIIPVIGIIFNLVFGFAVAIFMGRNGNYYYRLKKQHNISTLAALKDSELRRI